ncbi:MAG: hypothetical protein JWR63_2006 [Conexibacter sp.]|nr:hypothetical protein [Conexibacter sp.]
MDIALWRIESEISAAMARGALKDEIEPAARVDPDELMPD